ncbi:MAG: YerC/YecD family TrpR-related protein [Pseudoxanthomonas sp.]
MKQRPEPLPQRDADASLKALARALAALDRPEEVRAFLVDLCTPAELEAMADRWRVVPLLLKGVPYREIHDLTQVSVTTVGRVARTLEHGAGGYAAALERLKQGRQPARASASH